MLVRFKQRARTQTGLSFNTKTCTTGLVNFADSLEQHDKRLEKVLHTLQGAGLTLNREKCVFRMTELQFMGVLLSEKGIGPTSAKVEAVKNAQPPKCAAEVRSFLGLVNFSARFISDLATKSEPLRKLTRKNVMFIWGKEQQGAFDLLKEELAKATSLAYFDPQAETRVVADASPVAVGAVLCRFKTGKNAQSTMRVEI